MIYRVAFYNRSSDLVWSTGVYANDDDQARQIGAVLLSRAYDYQILPEQVQIIQIPSLTSDEMTTT